MLTQYISRRLISLTATQYAFVRSVCTSSSKDFDIVIYGATGFTGRLVAEYMNSQYGSNGKIKWAMAGRSMDKLKQVCEEMNISSDVPLLVADASDKTSLTAMVDATKVVLTTVGPYQLYGNELLEACATSGTDYVDLCGEPAWMHEMIHKHQASAQRSGARIVFSCGFDSIPFDMGVYFLQQHAISNYGGPCSRVRGRVRKMKGTFSGGTVASFKETMSSARHNKNTISVLRDPFALTPGFSGPEQPKGNKPFFDEIVDSWVTPFVMASINTKNIHRSNMLLKHQYGADFVYDEMLMTGTGQRGEKLAVLLHEGKGLTDSDVQPGDGPTKEERESGLFDVLLVGERPDGQQVRVSVQGDRDPGYGSTCKMIAESAVCLLESNKSFDSNSNSATSCPGGVWTCAPAMGKELIERLQANAGLTFRIEI